MEQLSTRAEGRAAKGEKNDENDVIRESLTMAHARGVNTAKNRKSCVLCLRNSCSYKCNFRISIQLRCVVDTPLEIRQRKHVGNTRAVVPVGSGQSCDLSTATTNI